MDRIKSGITFLKTRDLDRTTWFYTQVMGFSLALDQKTCRIFKVCDRCFIGFCLTEGSTGSEEVILTFEMEDVDGFSEILRAHQAPIEIAPRINPQFKIYQMFTRDPNNYRIEIQRFEDEDWEQASVMKDC